MVSRLSENSLRRLDGALKPAFSCVPAGASVAECVTCARDAVARLRHGWLRVLGAPDYQAYLAHHAKRHPDTPPLSERDYVAMFIEHRYNRAGAARCC